ncbi:MAG: hypothetical protein H7070_09855 [Saprospiraceae bacterium]|nr:hypothetical protein [Pyrinomonadaceae bacterium]
MKNLRNIFGWITLVTILTVGTTFANTGIIIAGEADGGDPCVDQTAREGIIIAGRAGIIIAGAPGIIIAGIAGIIIAGTPDEENTCGIIIAG